MNSYNQSNLGDDYIQNSNNDEIFYVKNDNSPDYVVIPITLIKTPELNIKELTCIFCNHISINPKKCHNCSLLGCNRCIKNAKNLNNIICLDSETPHNFIDLQDDHQINFDHLLISCPSRDSNCKETILYKNLKSHLDKCKFWKGTFSCSGCGKNDILTEIECHVLECDQISWNCDFCNSPFKRKELGIHMENCDSKPTECMKCNLKFPNKIIEKHMSKDECLYQIMMEMKTSFNGNFNKIFNFIFIIIYKF